MILEIDLVQCQTCENCTGKYFFIKTYEYRNARFQKSASAIRLLAQLFENWLKNHKCAENIMKVRDIQLKKTLEQNISGLIYYLV